MNLEIALAIQKVCTGETVELTVGQIAEHAVELDKMTANMSPEKAERCKAYYQEMISDETKKVFDADSLMDEIHAQEKKFKHFVYNEDYSDQFPKMVDAIEELLMNSPFIGLDAIPYGVAEVCIFSTLEFFTWKKLGLDHELHRNQYYDALVNMTEGEAVADYWIKVYDGLQKRFETLGTDFSDENHEKLIMIACSLMALSAMRDHDDYMLDIVLGGAKAKAEEILDELNSGDYEDGFSDVVDNAVSMFKFLQGYFIED